MSNISKNDAKLGYTEGTGTLIIKGMTMEQIKCFLHWYTCQGAQDHDEWFDINEIPSPMSNCSRPGGFDEIDKKAETVTAYFYTPPQNETIWSTQPLQLLRLSTRTC